MTKETSTPACENCDVRFESVFCDMKARELEKLTYNKECTYYRKGESIFAQGGLPQGLYCVNSGKIKLVKTGTQGKEQIVRLSKAGDALGYRALLSNEPYTASAIALEDSSVCVIEKDIILTMLKNSDSLSLKLMNLLTHDLAKAEEKITHISQHSLRERIAEGILILKETYGCEADGATLSVILSREDLANMIGTATESVIRFLSEFKHDKMIDLVGKKIKILDLPKLIHTANIEE